MMKQKPEDKEVLKFMNELEMIDHDKSSILSELREIVFQHFPETTERIMYGGIVFFLEDEMYSGLFAAKNHVTLEFSRGFLMKDPKSHLEGKGKFRRHLKFFQAEDISGKEASFFIEQAV